MFAIYEEAGKFFSGRILSETDTSLQIELESGKRAKVKAQQVLLKFPQPEPASLLAQGQSVAEDIDLDLAWEFAPEGEFHFAVLAADYFSDPPSLVQQWATCLKLHENPHYFRRSGKGHFKKAPAETVKAALLAIERKAQMAAQVDAWAQDLAQGHCPPAIAEQLYRILFKPDKNALETKAVLQAAKQAKLSPLDLFKRTGALDSPYQFHWKRFLFEHFPKGTGFAALQAPLITEDLPTASVQAFSIDDSSTTEIDDALSVTGLGSGKVSLGIHIAAPGLAFAPQSSLDQVARQRLSTVYMPGHKITMLPDEVVQTYTLLEGRDCPAVSLYVQIDETTLEISGHETKLERVPIASNLRHDLLDQIITEESLLADLDPDKGRQEASYPHAAELAFTYRLAKHLKLQREAVRGKPETFNRPDFSFKLPGVSGEPRGDEAVEIGLRKRGSPMDLIVAEAMILANSTWGGWLDECGVPGIYRSQHSLAPGMKVRMGTKPLPHAGMGVAQYTWATSPLRRYVDLVNQWQIIACARHGRAAPLSAAFKPKDTALFAIISAFDSAYADYADIQSTMERYWTLKFVEQSGIREWDAAVLRDGWVRTDALPLHCKALGAESLPRGARIQVSLSDIDFFSLDVQSRMLCRLDDPDRSDDDAALDAEESEGGDDEAPLSTGIVTLGLDMDTETSADPSPGTPA